MEKHYRRILKDTEEKVIGILQRQVKDKTSPRYGAVLDQTGIARVGLAIASVSDMTAVYCCQDSVFYHHRGIYESIQLSLSYIRKEQHENGLFDLLTCNFFSAPDTAFYIKNMLPVYVYLGKKKDRTPEESSIFGKYEKIIKDGARGLLEGGFHTPNHRWAIASALTECGKLFGSEEMLKAAGEYLKEGIDCNEDGEFSERSAGNYNCVNNEAMLELARVTGDDSYEEYVIRNLRMMLTYMEPDGSVFTGNSTRFDKDFLVAYPLGYYMEYLMMGMKYDIPEFLKMCNSIFDIMEREHIPGPDILIWFMLEPKYRTFEYEERYAPGDYHAFYRASGIARCRNGRYTYTVMQGKSNFLYVHNGSMKVEMKVCGSFCEHRSFIPQEMEQLGEGEYHLRQVMRGWYYLPFEEAPQTSDWWAMDNASRPRKLGPDMEINVWVKETKEGVDVRVKTSGVEGAPFRIELAFSGVNFLTGTHVDMPLSGSEVVVLRDGEAELSNGRDGLLVGPCFGAHHFTAGKEDSEKKNPGCATLYLTDYTSFDHVIHIRDKVSVIKDTFSLEEKNF